MAQFLAIKVNAKNDTSGNPRRGWKVFSTGTGALLGFVDEGYNGWQAVYNVGFLRDDILEAPGEFVITATEYKALKKDALYLVVSGRM